LGSTLGIAIFGNIFGLTLADRLEHRMAEATAALPPPVAAQMAALRSAPAASAEAAAGEEGAPAVRTFDEKAIVARVHEGFAARRAGLSAEAPPGALAALDQAEAAAIDGVKQVGLAFKTAFTEAVARIYTIAIGFALLGFLLAFFLRELPLRAGPAGPPPTE
jgi:hypothetical protein